ncbi:hypothetical protein COCCADRAFT_106244 [Bipolaris zeicola 26-R-13]|uniref:Uncharacterized protein n=1 Tax=Cochliobolus carbonum (strain 26-R-13) TaxID=930089 RepID=W6XUV4_COCC2|nr:uncharacterized protein COCCADRAFT_106244 [Bipolaris zeicola 26-R-13]EUC29538.1 hypothetical protein COCCADRAFT_106244 [Bipolaris zeicola 26-R-13]
MKDCRKRGNAVTYVQYNTNIKSIYVGLHSEPRPQGSGRELALVWFATLHLPSCATAQIGSTTTSATQSLNISTAFRKLKNML